MFFGAERLFQVTSDFRQNNSKLFCFAFQKQPPEVFCNKRSSQKFCKTYRKTPVPETFLKMSLCRRCFPMDFCEISKNFFCYKACNLIKNESLIQVLSCEFCKISKNFFCYRTPPDDCFWHLLLCCCCYPDCLIQRKCTECTEFSSK